MRLGPYLVASLLALPLCSGDPTHAAFVLNLTEAGGDVVATGSGTINTSGLSFGGYGGNFVSIVTASDGYLVSGPPLLSPAVKDIDFYDGTTGPSNFGTGGGSSFADLGGGDTVGVLAGNYHFVMVPRDYISNSSLNSYATWSGKTFASLGLTSGTYTWTWGTGVDSDSFTLNIGAPSVPEPSSVVMLGLGSLGLIGAATRRRPVG